jgi:hypothetical protein
MTGSVFRAMVLAFSFAGFYNPAEAGILHRTAGGDARAAVPRLDIDAGCRDLAHSDLSKTDYPKCVVEEQTARIQLQHDWGSFSASSRDQCMYLVTPPALPSYVTLQECLNLARDADKLSKKGLDRSLSPTPK